MKDIKAKKTTKEVTKKVVVKKADVIAKTVEKAKVTTNTTIKKAVRKPLTGMVMSVKMQNTVVVAIERKVAHKLYRKLIKVTNRLKADTNGMKINLGDKVSIEQTRPMSKDKNFKVIKIWEASK